jgi:hypothetical protein
MGEVSLTQVRTLFQHNHPKAGFGELLGDAATRGAGPDDQEVHRIRYLEPGGHLSNFVLKRLSSDHNLPVDLFPRRQPLIEVG